MSEWPFFGGLFAALAAVPEALKWGARVAKYLMTIGVFLVVVFHAAHLLGAPVPDPLPFLPIFGSGK